MRLKRSFRKKNHRRLTALRSTSLAAISMYAFSQLVSPTHALLLAKTRNEASLSAAFVFPKTVQDMVNQVSRFAQQATSEDQAAKSALSSAQSKDTNADAAKKMAANAASDATAASHAAGSANAIVAVLAGYDAKAQDDFDAAQHDLQSFQRVLDYVHAAYLSASADAASATQAAKVAQSAAASVAEVAQLKADQEKQEKSDPQKVVSDTLPKETASTTTQLKVVKKHNDKSGAATSRGE